jgi:hypothetical protein
MAKAPSHSKILDEPILESRPAPGLGKQVTHLLIELPCLGECAGARLTRFCMPFHSLALGGLQPAGDVARDVLQDPRVA